MPVITHLRSQDFLKSQWKNGLGWTSQIAIFPPGADLRKGDFLWRVSTAQIQQSSNFSLFPDHDRILVVLSGNGVKLSHFFDESEAPELVEVRPLQPYDFPGDIPTHCELLNGSIQDFSVFLRTGEANATCAVLNLEAGAKLEWEPRMPTSFLFVAEGALEVNGMSARAQEAFRIEASQLGERLQLIAPCQARIIELQIE